jgi:hypothetical protein
MFVKAAATPSLPRGHAQIVQIEACLPGARSPKAINFEALQRGADAAEAAIRAAEDQLVAAMKAEEARATLHDPLTRTRAKGTRGDHR